MTYPAESAILATGPLPATFAGGRAAGRRRWPLGWLERFFQQAPCLVGSLAAPGLAHVRASSLLAFEMLPLAASQPKPAQSAPLLQDLSCRRVATKLGKWAADAEVSFLNKALARLLMHHAAAGLTGPVTPA